MVPNLSNNSATSSSATGGTFGGGSGNQAFGDITFGNKTGDGISNTTLYVALAAAALVLVVWMRRK